ncbi:hypothetical protein DLAC_03914 [Tieghemostelium lacteum]|uniref:NADH-ubiquinone oxidoreductase 21kDa subunit N-terminal domain-containing protein n=1 Tax=Tieghemostelium lacteum TaxID=361077 RepID=A0A152A1F6_TIELA|nr:hypothetical protein DLAC_03914 [Tieghemostelium lacteum]|eukprot:KYQ99946.1 hypothetical protein DLAC_03914 [Tieghemostelium lacteum]
MTENRNILTGSIFKPVNTPQYPVIYKKPTFSQVMQHFRFSDYCFALGVPFVLTSSYYIATYRHSATTGVWASFAFPAIYLLTCERVNQRLMGYTDNEKECKKLNVPFTFTSNPYTL